MRLNTENARFLVPVQCSIILESRGEEQCILHVKSRVQWSRSMSSTDGTSSIDDDKALMWACVTSGISVAVDGGSEKV